MARTEVTGLQIKDGSVSLTADVVGILPVANGGTGSDTLALNNVLLGNGTGALQAVAPGATGNVLTSNGTTWTSAAATGGTYTSGTVGSSAYFSTLKRAALDTNPESAELTLMPGFYNDLAFNNLRGGTTTVTKNGADATPTQNGGDNWLRPDTSLTTWSTSAALVSTDTFVITVTPYDTTSLLRYAQYVGIGFPGAWGAKNVTIEVFWGGAWNTIYAVTNSNISTHTVYYNANAASPITQIRYTLTNLQIPGGIAQFRISSLFAFSYTSGLLSAGYMTREGGSLYGTNAAPPTLQASGGDANIDLDLRSKGTGAVEANGVPVVTTTGTQTLTNKTLTNPVVSLLRDSSNNVVASFIGGGADNYLQFTNRTTYNPHITATGNSTNIDLSLNTKGTGVVMANNIPVVTTTGAQSLTNKTISGASNTITNLPASATPDAARKVREHGTSANNWYKIVTYSPGAVAYARLNVVLVISSFNTTGAIISVTMGNNAADANPTGAVEFLSKGNISVLADNAFKIVANGYGQPIELWVQTVNSNGSALTYYESSRYFTTANITYDTSNTAVTTEPVGTVLNARSAGVVVNGEPVVTTTGTATLTNKTLTSPQVNQLLDTSGNTAFLVTPVANAVNYLQTLNNQTGGHPQRRAAGADANLSLWLIPKGTGTAAIYAGTGLTPTVEAIGADANHDLNLVPKGTGTVKAKGVPVVAVAPGTTGNVLTSDGTTWTSAAPSGGGAVAGFTTTVTSATAVVLTSASNQIQEFTGSTAQTVRLPSTDIVAGRQFTIINNSSALLTMQTSTSVQIHILAPGTESILTALVATPTTAAHWEDSFIATSFAAGKALTVNNTLTLAGTDGTTMTFPGATDTVVTLGAAQTLTSKTLTTPTLTTPVINGIPTGTGVATAATANTLVLRGAGGTVTGTFIESTTAVGTVGATATLALAGTVQTATLTSNTPCTFTMPAVQNGASFVLYLRQPAAGTPTTATFSGVRWGTNGAPVITAVLGRMDILTFFSDGTNWFGQVAQGFQY